MAKHFFYCHKQFLLTYHKYRKNKKTFFNNIIKMDVPPLPLLDEGWRIVAKHVGKLVINLELAKEWLLSYVENVDTSQSHLEYKGYSCHQKLLSTWHHSYNSVDGVMVNPSNGEAWKYLNGVHPWLNLRNMHLKLCTNKFNSFKLFAAPYFCWPMILTIYNLPPMKCMELQFIFLSIIILDLNSPGWNIDVCLCPLIDELWSSRDLTYDVSKKQNFQMKTTLMWTINNFLEHEIIFYWNTQGKLTCLYCMENNKAYTLINNGKTSSFSFIATSSSY